MLGRGQLVGILNREQAARGWVEVNQALGKRRLAGAGAAHGDDVQVMLYGQLEEAHEVALLRQSEQFSLPGLNILRQASQHGLEPPRIRVVGQRKPAVGRLANRHAHGAVFARRGQHDLAALAVRQRQRSNGVVAV